MISALSIPFMIWSIAYAHLAWHHGRWNLVAVRVHESGRYTLFETVTYWDHFLRELPIDVFYGLCIFASYRAIGVAPAASSGLLFPLAAGAFAVFVLLAFAGSASRKGIKESLVDLLQAREVDDVVAYGSHWQMHFLSTLTLMLIFLAPAFLVGDEFLALFILGAFLLFSALFRTGLRAVSDTRWILHGCREIATYVPLVGVPALLLAGETLVETTTEPGNLAIGALLILSGLVGYQASFALTRDIRRESRAVPHLSIPYLFSSHLFEHALDVVFIGLLLSVLCSA